MLQSGRNLPGKKGLLVCCLGHYLILEGGKFLKNVTQFISLTSSVVSMDLNQTTERLKKTKYSFKFSTQH